jgi:hypothetical protein
MPKALGYWTIGATATLMIAGAMLMARGHQMVVLDGVLQHGFEKSDFYDRGNCSRKPWWFDGIDADAAFHKQWESLGRPSALHIKFVGNVSSIGRYGHLGKYWREVVPVQILEVSSSNGCVRSEVPVR